MYVSMAKRKVLECIELPGETLALLTSNDKETNLHAVPLWSVTLKSMARLLKHYRGRYTTVVGFQPTGWTQKQGAMHASWNVFQHAASSVVTHFILHLSAIMLRCLATKNLF